jgi:hypothetical protein
MRDISAGSYLVILPVVICQILICEGAIDCEGMPADPNRTAAEQKQGTKIHT